MSCTHNSADSYTSDSHPSENTILRSYTYKHGMLIRRSYMCLLVMTCQ